MKVSKYGKVWHKLSFWLIVEDLCKLLLSIWSFQSKFTKHNEQWSHNNILSAAVLFHIAFLYLNLVDLVTKVCFGYPSPSLQTWS